MKEMKGKQLNGSSDNIYFNNDEIWKKKKEKKDLKILILKY